jgi:hypothetical protein
MEPRSESPGSLLDRIALSATDDSPVYDGAECLPCIAARQCMAVPGSIPCVGGPLDPFTGREYHIAAEARQQSAPPPHPPTPPPNPPNPNPLTPPPDPVPGPQPEPAPNPSPDPPPQ